MKSLAEATKLQTGSKTEQNIIEFSYKDMKFDVDYKLRLLGNYHPAYKYWIPTRDNKVTPIIAKGFNPETESWDFIDEDPLYKIVVGSKNKLLRLEFYYTINCIDRSDGLVKILPLKSTIFNAIVDLVKNPEYGDPTDPVTGYDILLKKTKTGPKPQNIKYVVTPSRKSSPLTPEEQKLKLYELDKIIRPRDNYIEYINSKSDVLLNAGLDLSFTSNYDEESSPF